MKKEEFDKLRNQLSVEAKNGIDFTIAATIVWAAIAFIWSLGISAYNRSILVFIVGAPLLLFAFLLSKILKTNWKIQDNPLQPLGLWLNLAQLFYFPFLFFILIKSPDYFIMAYAIITGAHLFPYSWFYKTTTYALFGGIISVGSLFIGLIVDTPEFWYIGLFTSVCLMLLTLAAMQDLSKKRLEP